MNGSEIEVGGSIIMPMAMTMVETMRSMTRNGRTTRKPISKPRRISEIMKAGMMTRMSMRLSSSFLRKLSAASASKVWRSLLRTWASMNSRNGSVIFR